MLAAVGMYAITATALRQQTRDIGVRIALGASQNDVRLLVLAGASRVLIPGAAVGLIGAFAAAPTLRSMLFGVSPGDPITLVGASAFLIGVALLAVWIPARRAARIDAVRTLRAE